MKEREIETDHLSNLSMLSYGMGDFLFQIFNGIFGAFYFLFWETEVGLNVWLVFIAYVVYAIWNSINDPLVGYFADKPNKFWKKYGKRYPLVLIAGIPAILTLAAIFSPPNLDPVSGAWIYLSWILITTCSYEFFFTILSLNHGALFPDKFRKDQERRKVGFIRMGLALIGTAIGFIVPPFFIEYGNRQSYGSMAWIFVIVNIFFFLTMIPGHKESRKLRERYTLEDQSKQKVSFLKTLKILVSHKNFMVVMIVFLMDSIIGAALTASIQYIAKYILLSETNSILILAGFILGALGSLAPWLILSQKMKNNRKMLIIGVFFNTIFLLPFMFVNGLIAFTIAALLLGIGGGALRIGTNPVIGDTVDELTLKTGQHIEGSFMGVYTFFLRFALIVQGFMFAIVHELTGFDQFSLTQTELAQFGIRLHTALIPMILTLIGLVIFVLFYDLKPEKTKEIKEKLKELNL